jgi:hypothetical protein
MLLAEEIMTNDENLLPLGVLAAIGIFITREILDFVKQDKARKRKVRAFKSLLAEELELNHWAYKKLLEIITKIGEDLKDNPEATYKIQFREMGNEYIRGHDGEKIIFDAPLVVVRQKYYDQLITDIAALDVDLFNVVQDAYEEVRNMAHVREGLLRSLMAKDFDEPFPHDMRCNGFLEYANRELKDAFQAMEKLYVYCTGKEFTSFRVR